MRPGFAYVFIRAVLDPSISRDEFDTWYDEHLLLSKQVLKPLRGWRFWSDDEAPEIVHYATYEFESPAARDAAYESDDINILIAQFSERWGDSVSRIRSRVVVASEV
jgi:hypothetical protein